MTFSLKEQNQVIFHRFHGEVCIDDMLQSWKELFASYQDLGSYKGILSSLLDAEVKHEDNNMNVMVEFLKGYLDRIKGMKVAMVTDTPLVTNTIIMNQKMKNMHIRPFSTEEEALDWINT